MNWKEILGQVFLDGGPSTCQFAITNACNAKCGFCSFSREHSPKADSVQNFGPVGLNSSADAVSSSSGPLGLANAFPSSTCESLPTAAPACEQAVSQVTPTSNPSTKPPVSPKTLVQLSPGLNAIDCLYRNGVRFLIFTGGEPTINPYLEKFMQHAQELGMESLVVTNGSTLSPEKVEGLIESGLREIIISIDSVDPQVSENNRGLPGVTQRIVEANKIFADNGVGRVASVTLSKILGDLTLLPQTLKSLGFQAVTFSFPLVKLDSNYLGYKDSDLVSYTPEEMHKLIDDVMDLKKSYAVLNPSASLEDMHRFLDKKPQEFPCLGGFKQFYLDWNLQLWRCCNWRRPMCHVFEFNGSQIIRDGCTECMIDCYRDASVMQACAVSLADAVHAACFNRWSLCAKHLFNMSNMRSWGAVLESSHWLDNL